MAFSSVRSEEDSLDFDAFYSDEFGVKNTATNIQTPSVTARIDIHKNRFTDVTGSAGAVRESSKNTAELTLQNPANPYSNPSLIAPYKQTQIPKTFNDTHNVRMYFSDSTIAAVAKGETITINVSILFAVGTEMNRHGLRSFFEKASTHGALILVPGTEPPRDPDRWGIALSDEQIAQLIKKQFKKAVAYTVKILAGFSTGACGLHQTLLHKLVNVDQVERLIYFDCLYENQCKATPAGPAITNLKARAKNAKIIVYQTSEKGNEYVKDSMFGRLAVPTSHPLLFDSRGIITNLFQQTNYISLVCFRSLEAAAKDGIVTIPKSWDKAFKDLEAALASTPRGSLISNKVAFEFVFGTKVVPTGKTFFEDWAKANSAALKAFSSNLGEPDKVNSVRYLLWKNQIPGWPGGLGEEKHDLLIPEFGWEFLV